MRTVICVASLDWDACWQAPQQVCALLAESGYRVLYVENTGVRMPGLRDSRRLAQRAANWLSGRGRFRQVRPNLHLYSPPAIPLPYSRVAQALNRLGPCRAIRGWLPSGPPPILLSFLPTRFALDLAQVVRPAVSAYWCAARFADSSPGARPIEADEAEVIRRFDLVMAISHDLEAHCRRFRDDVHRLPLGVHLETFEPAWEGECPEPAEMRRMRRPRVGYVGALHGAVDQDLMGSLSRQMPEADFVMVGPRRVSTEAMEGLPNLHLVGPREHRHIPGYVASFDVCLIPYLVNAYTQGVYPSKLNEYLALGKPVVSSPLREVRHFNEEFGGVVAVAEGAAGFRRSILESLHGPEDAVLQRRQVALRNGWVDRTAQLRALLEARL